MTMPYQFKFMLIKRSFTTISKFTELRKQKSKIETCFIYTIYTNIQL